MRVGAAVLERDDDPRSTRSTLSRSNHDAHRETVEAAAARTASWRLIATCAAVPTARVFGVDFADVSRSCGRAGDDKRYGLEFLSRVTSTINTNVKLNSLMRAPLPPPSRAVWFPPLAAVYLNARYRSRSREWMWPRALLFV